MKPSCHEPRLFVGKSIKDKRQPQGSSLKIIASLTILPSSITQGPEFDALALSFVMRHFLALLRDLLPSVPRAPDHRPAPTTPDARRPLITLTLDRELCTAIAMAYTSSLSAGCVASITLVLISTLLLAYETRDNIKFRPTPASEGFSYLTLLITWALALACHCTGCINEIAARILICSMLGVFCGIWWQRCTGPSKVAVDYLIQSVGCAHVGMIVALVWTRQNAATEKT